jgi:hypothetical protein
MSIFFWYKNAALIEKQHPMVAGFFRLKDRTTRRPGYAVDSIPAHLWKRTKEIATLLIIWAKFVKEMEEVWLQTRKKSETEERWLEQIQNLQAEIWQVLRIGDIQKLYNNAKETLPERARALLEPLEDLSSRVVSSPRDLNRFLKQWTACDRIQELRSRESEAAQRLLDISTASSRHSDGQSRNGEALPQGHLPSKRHLNLIKFDAINRVVYSRQELRVWAQPRQPAPDEDLADSP